MALGSIKSLLVASGMNRIDWGSTDNTSPIDPDHSDSLLNIALQG